MISKRFWKKVNFVSKFSKNSHFAFQSSDSLTDLFNCFTTLGLCHKEKILPTIRHRVAKVFCIVKILRFGLTTAPFII